MSMRTPFLLLGRHGLFSALLVLQIAVGFALLCQTWQARTNLQAQRSLPSGIRENEITLFPWLRAARQQVPATEEVLRILRGTPGVRHAAASNQSPYGHSAWSSSAWTEPSSRDSFYTASVYMGTEDLLETLGLTIQRGRDFLPSEYTDFGGNQTVLHTGPAAAILSASLADRLFPGTDALGRIFYLRDSVPLQVTGIVERMPLPFNGHLPDGSSHAVILPVRIPRADATLFLIRTAAENREPVAAQAHHALSQAYTSAAIAMPIDLSSLRTAALAPGQNSFWMLSIASAIWWLAALGMVALFGIRLVSQHAQELSLRRAMGATCGQIAAAWRREYLLLCVAGLVLGQLLSALPLQAFLPAPDGRASPTAALTVAACVVAGVQLAATWPVRIAARIPPHVVSRSPSVRL